MLGPHPVRAFIVVTSLIGLVAVGCGSSVLPSSDAATGTTRPLVVTNEPTTPATPVATPAPTLPPVGFVAMGDSYTIGTGVKPRDRWPNQLVRTLNPIRDFNLIGNLAVSGATSADVLASQVPQVSRLDPDLVSVQVGVNDVVQKVDAATYRAHVDQLFDALLQEVPSGRIFVVTIPDYTLTPQGSNYGDPTRQSARIRTFNQVLEQEAAKLKLAVVDITPVANLVADDGSLVAADGLHPSAKQYAGWVELIAPRVREMLDFSQ
jgi:acyl-CoA thioesterase I